MRSILNSFIDSFNPPPILSVAEWADEKRVLSAKGSAEPGRWRTDRTPYLKEVMECLSDNNPVNEVVVMKGAQVGFSECGMNWLGYTIDHSPAPILLVMPTLETVKRVSKQRIAPLIEETPSLNKKVNTKKTKDSDNTILMKDFPNGVLILAGANSPAGLRSMPAKKLFLDEIDEYPQDVGGQGDPVSLAEQRTKTFGTKKKIFKISTPTIEGLSRIADEFEDSDQRWFYVPCTKCGEYQKLTFKGLKWPQGKPEEAYYQCEHCDFHIYDHEKTKMLKAGKWIAENPGHKNKKKAGFHLSSLYSPSGWETWPSIAKQWVNIQKEKDTDKLKTFVNTVLGETWKEKSEVPDWHRLYERRETYPMEVVPEGAYFLTMGVDVQKDRIEAEVIAWGKRKENWSIGYYVLQGDTAEGEVWGKLDDLMAMKFPRADNEKLFLPIKMTCVDSGYQTQTIYTWARNHHPRYLSIIKGRDTLSVGVGIPTAVDVMKNGKKLRRGLKVWPLGVSHLKTEVYSWLRQNKPTEEEEVSPVGYSHFPEYDKDFFLMLTAEELVKKISRGYAKYEWRKIRERNESLDTRVYALAAAMIVGIDRFREKNWDALKGSVNFKRSVKSNVETKQTKKKTVKRRGSTWL